MINLMAYNDPTFINIHLDNNYKPMSLKIVGEQQKVYKGIVIMNEIPDEYYKVVIDGMYETKEITDQYGYVVDYVRGQIHFHSSITDGTVITINEYYGKGHILIPSNRIYTSIKSDGTPESMDDFLNSVDPFVFMKEWNNNTSYVKNNQVFYNGNTYICTDDCKGVIPTDNTKWRLFAAGFKWRGEYSSTIQYYERDVIRIGEGQWFICKKDCLNVDILNTEYWEKIVDLLDVAGGYQDIVDEIEDKISELNTRKNNYDSNLVPSASQAIQNANSKAAGAEQATNNCNTAIENYQVIYAESVQYPKNPVPTFDDLSLFYPEPENGWTVKTLDNSKTYRYDSSLEEWVWIDTVSLDSHTHPNKPILDKITEENGNLQYNGVDIIDHTHSNKDTLDKFSVVDGELLFNGQGIDVEEADSSTEIYDWGTEAGDRIMTLTEGQYNALTSKNSDTIYLVICEYDEAGEIDG